MNSSQAGCGESHPHTLKQLGWTEEQEQAFKKYSGPYVPGRVACRQKTVWELFTDGGFARAGISGALRKLGRFPAVGDFVVLLHQPEAGSSTIVDILPQKSRFTRGTSGREGTDQVIAANIDTVFIVTAAGHDLSARRTERYLAIAHASGARPVIVINKSDLAEDPSSLAAEILPVVFGHPGHPGQCHKWRGDRPARGVPGPGHDDRPYRFLRCRQVNADQPVAGPAVQETSHIRDYDGKGRHTTTVRQLFVLKGGALMIDNPGLREVGIGTAATGIADTFPEIPELAKGCRFSDCRHEQEPGCAVLDAVKRGTLSSSRLENYHRLVRELAFEQDKAEIGLVRSERKRWKGIAKFAKEINKAGK